MTFPAAVRVYLLVFLVIFGGHRYSAQTSYTFLKLKPFSKCVFPDALSESSGLTVYKGTLYTLNDSGNAPVVYEINPENCSIQKEITINATNTDWEALASDEDWLYIGDFGNNRGSRRDLSILKIDPDTGQVADKLLFEMADQKDFSGPAHAHDYDMEAMVVKDSRISLFSKSWKSSVVRRYTLDTVSQTEKAILEPLERAKLPYVVTDAALYGDSLFTLGYTKNTEVYLTVFTVEGDSLLTQPKTYFLGMAYSIGQIEGIAASEKGLYISGESFRKFGLKTKAQLYFIPWEKLN